MKRSLHFVILGDPIPLARPRLTERRVWDSQKKLKFDWGLQIESQFPKKKQLAGALLLDVTFFMGIPPSWSDQKKQEMTEEPHIFKPDVSNMIKFVEDCCQGIVFKDDCQIAVINCKKVYDPTPRTEFTIKEL